MQVEIHITTSEITEDEVDHFINFCRSIDVKPIVIELSDGDIQQHPMISKRVEVNDRMELQKKLDKLRNSFAAAGYHIERVKLEVDARKAKQGQAFFPDFKGGYFEWHGKIYSDRLEEVYRTAKIANAHISKNGLKGIENRRILTLREIRNERSFYDKITSVKRDFRNHKIDIVQEESEYCIYDSNKTLDRGWLDTPEITDQAYLDLLAFEAFLRRAAELELPFMLKGSLLTRQFYKNKEDRIARDIDYLYFGTVKDDVTFMDDELSNWVEKVTSFHINDEVTYRPFSENKFWRAIDYAMHDDFPTTNTDLYCTVKGIVNPIIGLDVSWGLPLNVPVEPLLYYPQEGEPFEIKYTAPLSLQISWKLHQCLVRPRLKDLVDLIYLLEDAEVSKDILEIAVVEFIKECNKDKINSRKIFYYTSGNLRRFLKPEERIWSRIFSAKKEPAPKMDMGELNYDTLKLLAFTFPNYQQMYNDVPDILLAFEEVMRKINFEETYQRISRKFPTS